MNMSEKDGAALVTVTIPGHAPTIDYLDAPGDHICLTVTPDGVLFKDHVAQDGPHATELDRLELADVVARYLYDRYDEASSVGYDADGEQARKHWRSEALDLLVFIRRPR